MENKKDNLSILKGYNMLLLFAGSMLMYEPTRECVIDFWKNGLLKQLPVKSMNPRFVNAASQLKESVEDRSLSINDLQDDYKRLFLSGEGTLVPVKESGYKETSYAHMQTNTKNVSEFYNSYGWVSRSRVQMADDHLGIEILFLTRLIENYMSYEDIPCRNEMRNEIRRFIGQHLLTWIPFWNEKIQEHANTLCYKGIGTLIHACIEDIDNVLAMPDTD